MKYQPGKYNFGQELPHFESNEVDILHDSRDDQLSDNEHKDHDNASIQERDEEELELDEEELIELNV